ncbi:MAG: carboxypeptidase regulatory-like domain-containing protein [Acidobacteria bacterium]|nr:carboxypeptidase regulatory-like domain-containing protein [Acidobacteriota bacterium]
MKVILTYAILFSLVLVPFSGARAQSPTGVIKGKVKEQGGKPLVDVLVKAQGSKHKDRLQETKSNDKGEFELGSIPAGDYTLTFEKQGYKLFTTRSLEVLGGETLRLSKVIELAKEGDPYAVIRGAVLQGVGYSLSSASVLIERIDGGRKFKQETISREGGEFAFRLRAEKARYRLTASARGFQSSSIELDIEGDEVRNIALTLKPAP